MSNSQRTRTSNKIIKLYKKNGTSSYSIGEKITQIEHGLQAAKMAEDKCYDEEIIIAALLHDIGHILEMDTVNAMGNGTTGNLGVKDHEKLGAEYLRKHNFPERVVSMVLNHVNTKRYLVSKNEKYKLELSDASLKTLEFQNGKMTDRECCDFENDPYFKEHLIIRELDDLAKEEYVKTKTLDDYKYLIDKLVN